MIEILNIEDHCSSLSSEEVDAFLFKLELNLMDAILEKKMNENKIVFSEVENGLLN